MRRRSWPTDQSHERPVETHAAEWALGRPPREPTPYQPERRRAPAFAPLGRPPTHNRWVGQRPTWFTSSDLADPVSQPKTASPTS